MWFLEKLKQKRPSNRSMVSVRMEAIGGQGAHSAGKILAEAAVLRMKYNGNHFSSFGSEKRGAPVKSFVRFSTDGGQVRSASYIQNPDILMIFHESLMFTHPDVLDGACNKTDLIINTHKKPHELKFPKEIQFKNIITIDALSISSKLECRLNMIMLGALSTICPEVSESAFLQSLDHFFSKLPENLKLKNESGFKKGMSHCRQDSFRLFQSVQEHKISILPVMGWVNAPLGGVIVNPGNIILKDQSASRKGTAPRFIKEICFNCGYCEMVCPDYCFVWKEEGDSFKLQGIDYQYCKGCQKCIEVCPVGAIQLCDEKDLTDEDKNHHLFDK